MICNSSKCKEIIFCKKGFIQDIAQVNNIPQCAKLAILGVTFQENYKYTPIPQKVGPMSLGKSKKISFTESTWRIIQFKAQISKSKYLKN